VQINVNSPLSMLLYALTRRLRRTLATLGPLSLVVGPHHRGIERAEAMAVLLSNASEYARPPASGVSAAQLGVFRVPASRQCGPATLLCSSRSERFRDQARAIHQVAESVMSVGPWVHNQARRLSRRGRCSTTSVAARACSPSVESAQPSIMSVPPSIEAVPPSASAVLPSFELLPFAAPSLSGSKAGASQCQIPFEFQRGRASTPRKFRHLVAARGSSKRLSLRPSLGATRRSALR
jgi:hypothetical protein